MVEREYHTWAEINGDILLEVLRRASRSAVTHLNR